MSLDELTSIIIRHDGKGHGAGWFLDKIFVNEVDEEDVGNMYLFPCDRWFDDHEFDRKVERELFLAGKFSCLNTCT